MPGPGSAILMRFTQLRLRRNLSPSSFVRGRRFAALVGIFVAVILVGCNEKEAPQAPKPPDVEVAEVTTQDVPVWGEWVAQLNGPVNADITPKVQGYLLSQDYTNGAFVKKGQLLFKIDPRPFEAALDQAKADVERAMASLAKANNDVERDTPLAAQRAIPQKQLDDDKAAQAWSTAQLAASKAQQQQAELNLGWTKVYSPVSGIAGAANSQIGDLVGTSTKMTTVSQIDPIWAYFNVSESLYLGAASQIRKALQKSGTSPVPIEYIQANDVPYPFKGTLIFINREITAGTGTIQLAAAFPNHDATLRPGGFGRVRVMTGYSRNAMLVPQASVIEVQSQYQIIVVSPDNKATVRPVKVGDRVGSKWIITEGLKPGEKVVVEGIQKVQTFAAQSPQAAKEGIPVTPKPYVAELDGSS
ncbi:MAG TPA: efflux RND transporter periplasmic adaptor subunit [Terriglobales bacterium]|nr:efflux RND transporter periplasmic adaptor subunit [Terriglobales bacterium]